MIGGMADTISIADARARVAAAAAALPAEDVPVAEALGRVLAEDVHAERNVPPFDNSAMDGYAVRPGPAGRVLRIVGESRAGAPAGATVGEQEAVRISTGAAMPGGATAVVRVEDTRERDGSVEVGAAVDAGASVREAGEDMREGELVVAAGTRLGPAELGALVVAGRGSVRCGARPRVAVRVTGDELVDAGAPLGPGQIHDSNLHALRALAERAGAEVVSAERVPDTAEATRDSLAAALEGCDLLLASGGVSVGRHDHVKDALRELGAREEFWGVALQPGKPTWFGTRGDQLVLALPGNPVSAMVCFALFGLPALRGLAGESEPARLGEALLAEPVERMRGRERAVRVRLEARRDGLFAHPTGPQASHMTTSMLGADALALVPAGEGELEAGTAVALEALPR
jgi:molybdopterin molybdotransferase